MDEQRLREWQELNYRYANEELLTAAEMATYEAGCKEMDETEYLDGNIEQMRQLFDQLANIRADLKESLRIEAEQDAEIAKLTARLDSRTRQLLGIEG